MNVCPDLSARGIPPALLTDSGTIDEHFKSYTIFPPGLSASIIPAKTTMHLSAESIRPLLSINDTRSPSPSNATPRSAPDSTTVDVRTFRFAATAEFGLRLGNEPSGTQNRLSVMYPTFLSIDGAISEKHPLPQSTTTLSVPAFEGLGDIDAIYFKYSGMISYVFNTPMSSGKEPSRTMDRMFCISASVIGSEPSAGLNPLNFGGLCDAVTITPASIFKRDLA